MFIVGLRKLQAWDSEGVGVLFDEFYGSGPPLRAALSTVDLWLPLLKSEECPST